MNKNFSTKIFIIIIMITIMITTIQFQGCLDDCPNVKMMYTYSFEEDMQGWDSSGIDLDNPPINWSVNRSDQLAYEGNYSVRILLDNLNDAGKIWMEKEFDVIENTNYSIIISYKFATADYGDFNLFRIITGVSMNSPSTVDELTFQKDTGHHTDVQGSYVWLNKSYNFSVFTENQDSIYVTIGVWGTWETLRIYYVDRVEISFEII